MVDTTGAAPVLPLINPTDPTAKMWDELLALKPTVAAPDPAPVAAAPAPSPAVADPMANMWNELNALKPQRVSDMPPSAQGPVQSGNAARAAMTGFGQAYSTALKGAGASLAGQTYRGYTSSLSEQQNAAGGYAQDLQALEEAVAQAPDEDTRAYLRDQITELRNKIDQTNLRLEGLDSYTATDARMDRIEPSIPRSPQERRASQDYSGVRTREEVPGAIGSDHPLYKMGADLDAWIRENVGEVDIRDQSYATQAAGALGNLGGVLSQAVLGTLVAGPAGGVGTAMASGAASNAGMIYDEAKALGADEETAQKAAQYGGAAGVVLALPVMKVFKFLPAPVRAKFATVFTNKLASITADFGVGVGSMYAANVANNIIAQKNYDEERGLNDNWEEALFSGAIIGGAIGAVQSAPAIAAAMRKLGKSRATEKKAAETGVDPAAAAALSDATSEASAASTTATSDVPADAAAAIAATGDIDMAALDRIMKGTDDKQPAPEAPQAPGVPPTAAGPDAAPAAPQAATKQAADEVADWKNPRRAIFIPFEDNTTPPPVGAKIKSIVTDAGVVYINTGKGIGLQGARQLQKQGQLESVLGLPPTTRPKTEAPAPAAAPAPEVPPVRSEAAAALDALAPPEVAPAVASEPAPAVPPVRSEAAAALDALKPAEAAPAATPEPAPVRSEAAAALDALKPAEAAPVLPDRVTAPARPVTVEVKPRPPVRKAAEPPVVAKPEPAPAAVAETPPPRKPSGAVVAERLRQERASSEGRKIQTREDLVALGDELSAIVAKAEAEGITPPGDINAPAPAALSWLGAVREMAARLKGVSRIRSEAGLDSVLKFTQKWVDAEAKAARDGDLQGLRDLRAQADQAAKPVAKPVVDKAEVRAAAMEEVKAKADAGKITAKEEAEARIKAGNSHRSRDVKERKVDANVEADRIRAEEAPKEVALVSSFDDLAAVKARVDRIVQRAEAAGIEIPKEVSDAVPNALAWLTDVKMMADRLKTADDIKSGAARKDFLKNVQSWLIDEVDASMNNNTVAMRARRKLEGEAIAGRRPDANVENLAQSIDESPVVTAEVTADKEGVADNASEARNSEAAARLTDSRKGSVRIDDATEKRTVTLKGGKEVEETVAKAASDVRKPTAEEAGLTPERIAAMFSGKGTARKPSESLTRQANDILKEAGMGRFSLRRGEGRKAAAARLQSTVAGITRWLKGGENPVQPQRIVRKSIFPDMRSKRLPRKAPIALDEVRPILNEYGIYDILMESDPTGKLATTIGRLMRVERDDTTGLKPMPGSLAKRFADQVEDPAFIPDGENFTARELRDAIIAQVMSEGDEAQINALSPLMAAFDLFDGMMPDMDVRIIPSSRMAEMPGLRGTYGFFDGKFSRLILSSHVFQDATTAFSTLVHEFAHGATIMRMAEDAELLGAFEDLRASLVRQLGKASDGAITPDDAPILHYGLTNAYEMVTEFFANAEFRSFLASVEYDKSIAPSWALRLRGELRTAYDYFVAAISRAIWGDAYDIGGEKVSGLDQLAQLIEHTLQTVGEIPANKLAENRVYKRDPMVDGLTKRGVTPEVAARLAERIQKDYGGKVTPAQLDAIAAAYKVEDAKAQSAAKAQVDAVKSTAVVKAEAMKTEAAGAGKKIVDTVHAQLDDELRRKSRAGLPKLLKLANLDFIAMRSDDFFGKENNPVRKFEQLWNSRGKVKRDLMDKMTPIVQRGAALADKYAKTGEFDAMADLMIDARMAGVHPNFALDHPMNKHLGKNSMRGAWGKAQHAALEGRWNALPDDLKAYYEEARAMYTDNQNAIARTAVDQIVKQALKDKGKPHDPAMALRFHDGTATDADRAAVGEIVAAHIERAEDLKKVTGPYFDLSRRGQFVVIGEHKVTPPGNGKLVEPDTVEFKTLDEAKKFLREQAAAGAPRSELRGVYYDKTTGKRTMMDAGEEVPVTAKDVNAERRFQVKVQTQHVEFVETRAEALEAQARLKGAGLTVRDIEPRRYDRESPNGEMLSDQMRAISESIRSQAERKGMDAKRAADLTDTLNEISLRFRGNTRIQRHLLPTKYVEGASRDILRNMVEYADRTAGYIARATTQGAINEALDAIDTARKEIGGLQTGAGEGARMIQNEIERRAFDRSYRHSFDRGPVDTAVNRLLSITFLRHLASPAYTMFNLMQPMLFANPVLSARYGAVKTQLAFIRGYKDVQTASTLLFSVADTARAVAGKDRRDYGARIIKGLKNKDEARMMQRLVDDQVIDLDAGLEVADLYRDLPKPGRSGASRLTLMRESAGQKLDTSINYLDNIARMAPAGAEAINRTVTALVAFRLEMKRSGDYELAYRSARDTVNQTQFNYSATNAAPVFNTNAGRVALQFKKFGMGSYQLLGRYLGRAIRGAGKGERAEAIRTLAYIMATHQLAAGFLGLPWEPAKLAVMALNGMGITNMTWADIQYEVEEFFQMIAGEKTGEVMANGISRMLPDFAAFDTRGRIGMDSMLTFGEPRDMDEESVKAYLFDMIAGAGTGTIADYTAGISQILSGDFGKASASMLPFKVTADMARATNETAAGRFNASDAAMRVLGLTSARIARINREKGASIRAAQKENVVEKKLISAYIQAITPADVAKATSAIREYNATLPAGERGINPKGLEKLRTNNARIYAE